MADKKPPKPKRLTAAQKEQLQIPELADEKNPKVHKAGLKLQDALDQVKTGQKKVKELQAELLTIMKMEKIPHYRYGDIDTTIVHTEKVKVKRIAPEKKSPKKKPPKGSLADSEDPPPIEKTSE